MAEQKPIVSHAIAFSTPWFDVVSKRVAGEPEPYYSLRMSDYVCVVALTADARVVLVRQYRPVVEAYVLELPAGHVEKDQTPEEAGRAELAEETGFTANEFEFLGSLASDTGRNENRTWCYLATDVAPPSADWKPESGIEVVLVPLDEVHDLILRGQFPQALNVAAFMLGILRRQRCLPSLLSKPGFTRS